jgi:hypothetical protein
MTSRYFNKTGHLTKDLLEQEYRSLGSLRKIAAKYNVDKDTIGSLFRKYNINYVPRTRNKDHFFFSRETEESFYLAGFIAADGNICNNYLHIGLSEKDEQHIIKLAQLLKSNAKIISYVNKPFTGSQTVSVIKSITIHSEQIYNDLHTNFNITPNKSLSLQFPKHLSNNILIRHFIRGYFDGDGSWSFRYPTLKNKLITPQLCFDILGTYNVVSEINNILHSNIDLPNNKIYKKSKIYGIKYSGNRLSKLIGDWIYQDSTIYLDRKHQRYLSLLY